jgi:hypothetical protein
MEFDSLTQMWVAGKQVKWLPVPSGCCPIDCECRTRTCPGVPAELQARNLNYWIEQERQQRETFFCRFDANRLRAVFTERYTAIDNMEVLTKILENGFDPAGEIQFALDDEMMLLKMPEYERAFHLVGADKIIPGISIANSPRSGYWPCPSRLLLPLVCTNGLIAKTAVDARYKHISRKVIDEFPTSCGALSASRIGDVTVS